MIYKRRHKKFWRVGKKWRGLRGGNFLPASRKQNYETILLQSASGFCSKKVLTSSNKHHHIELVASLGASPLASAGSFARKSKGFLKSIKSFCWLIWRFANLKSLLVFEKQTADFFLSSLTKGKTRFYQIVGVKRCLFQI